MSKIKVLKNFPFKGVTYYKGGYILKDKFTDIELSVLDSMGKIDYKPKKKVSRKKKSNKEE